MSKDKRKRKFFQGMEHLQETSTASHTFANPQISAEASTDDMIQHRYIRSDLIRVFILVSSLLAIIIGLMLIDRSSDKIQLIAEKLTSLIIR